MTVAIIPARGGSKRIPRKNIKIFDGQPIIAHVIKAARDAQCFKRVIVSTDDQEIAAVARQCGAETPFMRPAALADDYAITDEVTRHAITWLREHHQAPEYVCVMYPTAPFVTPQLLRQSLELLRQQPEKLFCFGVTAFEFPIQRAIKISDSGEISMFQPEHALTRSQDLEKAYHDAGQFYWGRAEGFFNSRGMFSVDAIPYILPRDCVQDIDTPEDWARAELMFKAWRARGEA